MRKICVVTSTRAEYGIMSRLIDKIHQDKDLELQLIATGMHLSRKFGHTIDEISAPVIKTIDIEIEKEPAYSIALAVENFSKAFKDLKPDIIVLAGDRYEIMGVAQAAMLNKIPIAHIHGGEATEGAMDETIRHCITKMSYLHFTTCEEYRKRVIQLGEDPKRVFNVGSLGVENITKIPLMAKAELEESLGFRFNKKNFLVTYHPVTLEENSKAQFKELLDALSELKETNIIITYPNSDEGSEDILELIKVFERCHTNVKVYKSLGIRRYLSTIPFVNAVVGNSSSGIIEVPSFGVATINVGNRQKGRIQASSVINCEPKKEKILQALNTAMQNNYKNTKNPYEQKNTAEKIITVIKNYPCCVKKEFYDLWNELNAL